MTTRPQNTAALSTPTAVGWDQVAPGELTFQFPRLTAPIRQLPDLPEEPQCKRLGMLDRFLSWLDEQF